MKQGRERGKEGGNMRNGKIESWSRARYHEDMEGKQKQWQPHRETGGKTAVSAHRGSAGAGDMDHEEAGEERGLPTLCRCQPLFPEPAGITQQGVDETAK